MRNWSDSAHSNWPTLASCMLTLMILSSSGSYCGAIGSSFGTVGWMRCTRWSISSLWASSLADSSATAFEVVCKAA